MVRHGDRVSYNIIYCWMPSLRVRVFQNAEKVKSKMKIESLRILVDNSSIIIYKIVRLKTTRGSGF